MEQEVMQAIRAELESNIDAKYREFHSSLVPGQNCRILGVRIPVSRRIAKAIARDHYEVYTEQFNPEVYEELLIRGMMIGYGKLTREEQTAELDCFVPMINSWGICDSSCATCHFMKKDQEYWYVYLQKWLKSSREYEIRFGVVCLLDFFINEAYIDAVLEEMKKIHHDGYYVKMAVAWAVSICYIHFPEKTQKLLKENSLDDWTHNKTIQKIRESLRISKEEKEMLKTWKR